MDYQTFTPGENLNAFIKCYWTLESEPEENPQKQTIVPDGCAEMIFHYGDLYRQYLSDGTSLIQPRCFVIGQLSRPLEIEPTGRTGIFSVRFHPDGLSPLLSVSMKDLEDTAVSVQTLFPHDREFGDRVVSAKTTEERIQLVEQFLLDLVLDKTSVDRIVRSTIETIITANGQLSVTEISEQLKVNRRNLERKFSANIGLSPKQLSKTVRLQATLKMLLSKEFTSLTALAYDGAYYDQAHFIKDFKEFTGLTPKEFYGDQFKMSALFSSAE